MEIVNFENLMFEKLAECEQWLGGKDKAIETLAQKQQEYESAKLAVAEYNEENILAVTNYKAELETKLGIAQKEAVAEVVEEETENTLETESVELQPTELI